MADMTQAVDYNQYQCLGLECHDGDKDTVCIKTELLSNADSDSTNIIKHEDNDQNGQGQGDFASYLTNGGQIEEGHEETYDDISFGDVKLECQKMAPGTSDASDDLSLTDSDSCDYVDDFHDPEYIPSTQKKNKKNKNLFSKTMASRERNPAKKKCVRKSTPTLLKAKTSELLSLPKEKHILLQHKEDKRTKGMLLHTGETKYKCPKCNKIFPNRQARHSHIYIHHLRIHPYKCSCGKTLANNKSLKYHRMLHERPTHECVLCEKIYHTRSRLLRHIKEVHPQDPLKTISCHLCEYSTKKQYNLVLHALRHHAEKTIPCTKCDRKFAMKRDLYVHQVTYHDPLTCKVCGKILKNKFTLNQHMRHIHQGVLRLKPKKYMYECHLCDKAFPYEEARSSHIKHVHLNIFAHECPTCGKRLASEVTLKTHLKLHQEASFQCTLCSKAYHVKKSLERHKKEVHLEELGGALHCVHCDFVAFKERSLILHNHRYHEIDQGIISCPQCDRRFALKKDLRIHTNTHHNKMPCEVCGKVLKGRVSLQNHVKCIHEGQRRNVTNSKRYYCDQCGKGFIGKQDFTGHMNSHSGIFPFSCSDCEKNFSSELTLKNHKKAAHSGIEHRCDECAKTFRSICGLKLHKQSHHASSDAKDHVCETCGKDFVTKASLIRHQRIHTGVRPYKCQLCSDAFNDYSILRRHMKGVHKSDDKSLIKISNTFTVMK